MAMHINLCTISISILLFIFITIYFRIFHKKKEIYNDKHRFLTEPDCSFVKIGKPYFLTYI